MLLYYITDRRQFRGDDAEQRRALLNKIAEAARANIDFIQLREKDLPIRSLEVLAREAVTIVRGESRTTRLLINSRIDIAIAVGADGVHLTSSDIAASEARSIWMRSGNLVDPIIGVSCHSARDVDCAASHGADFAVLAPVFGKIQTGAPGIGLQVIREATGPVSKRDSRVEAGDRREGIPVLALGGVTAVNARECVDAGAAGIAGIRMFQDGSGIARVAQPPSAAAVDFPPDKARAFRGSYRRKLPHVQKDQAALFVTFRTSHGFVIPETLREVALNHCIYENGRRIDLYAAVVMPDHVHLLFRCLRDAQGTQYSLKEIMGSIKGASAHSLNRQLGRKGSVWQDESFDHVLRNEERLAEKVQYILQNPVRKGLVSAAQNYKYIFVKTD